MPTTHKHTPARKKKTVRTVTKTKKKVVARKRVKTVSATMRKKAHEKWLDAVIMLGLLALAIEMAGFIWVGPGFTASVYTPPKQIETRFDRQNDTTGITAPKFTACERRAMKIRNQSRREQLLSICNERKRGAAPKESQEFLDKHDSVLTNIRSLGGDATVPDDDMVSPGN